MGCVWGGMLRPLRLIAKTFGDIKFYRKCLIRFPFICISLSIIYLPSYLLVFLLMKVSKILSWRISEYDLIFTLWMVVTSHKWTENDTLLNINGVRMTLFCSMNKTIMSCNIGYKNQRFSFWVWKAKLKHPTVSPSLARWIGWSLSKKDFHILHMIHISSVSTVGNWER